MALPPRVIPSNAPESTRSQMAYFALPSISIRPKCFSEWPELSGSPFQGSSKDGRRTQTHRIDQPSCTWHQNTLFVCTHPPRRFDLHQTAHWRSSTNRFHRCASAWCCLLHVHCPVRFELVQCLVLRTNHGVIGLFTQ